MKFLHEQNEDLNVFFPTKYNSLQSAVSSRHLEIVRYLLDVCPQLIDQQNYAGDTALMLASELGDLEIVDDLCQRGANLNLSNTEGKTALDLAREKNQQAVVDYLLAWQSHMSDGLSNLSLFTSGDREEKLGESKLVVVSKTKYSIFQATHLFDKFLQSLAFGRQDKVEQLFRDISSAHPDKIQEALRFEGEFTDYSGRTFNCTAYEYAYWAKDTHMCRILEPHMDDETKAYLLARIDKMEMTGLDFQQNGAEHRSAHFELTSLKEAYQRYLEGCHGWLATQNLAAIEETWWEVGKVQRNLPVHVAQEYYSPGHSNEETLAQDLTFYDSITGRHYPWFPLAASDTGLGFDFALIRFNERVFAARTPMLVGLRNETVALNLSAISRLDEVRTQDLALSRKYLNSSAAQSLSV